jgi:hypothetical protein
MLHSAHGATRQKGRRGKWPLEITLIEYAGLTSPAVGLEYNQACMALHKGTSSEMKRGLHFIRCGRTLIGSFIPFLFLFALVTLIVFFCAACRRDVAKREGSDGLHVPAKASVSGEVKAPDDLSTGLDLRSLTYWSKLALPQDIELVKDDNLGDVRLVYLRYKKDGEGIQLLLKADGLRSLSIGTLYPMNDGPRLKTVMPSQLSTNFGITTGASTKAVKEKYGTPKTQEASQTSGLERLEYKTSLPGSFIGYLTFTFDKGLLISITSTYFNPSEIEKWHKIKHHYNLENGKLMLDEPAPVVH